MNIDTQIVVAIIAVSGTLLGVLISHWGNLRNNRIKKLEDRIVIYKNEIKARQCQENIASEWISNLTNESEQTVKIKLRDLTENKCSIRPSMKPTDL